MSIPTVDYNVTPDNILLTYLNFKFMKTREKRVYFAPVIKEEEFAIEAGIASSVGTDPLGAPGAAGGNIAVDDNELAW